MRTAVTILLAALTLPAGASQAQLGLGLPPVALPSTAPPAPSARPPNPPAARISNARAPNAIRPKAAASVSAIDLPATQPPGVTAIPLAPGEIPHAAEVIPSSLPAGVAATAVSGANGATDVVLTAAGAPRALTQAVGIEPGSYAGRAAELLRRHGDLVEADDQGRPVVRSEVTGLGVSARGFAAARAAGFQVRSAERLHGLDLVAVVLVPPRGLTTPEALRRLRALDPAGRYDFNHIYFESGAVAVTSGRGPASQAAAGKGLRIGLVDGTALAGQPHLARTPLVQRAFAPGGARVTAHATAVASLLAGAGPGFRGAAPGATLYVADVYGPTPAGGSAVSVARALGWLAQARTPVINISLVGPPNALLQAGVAALVAKGHLVVAAVGNDGPGAPPLYPAAYPGVVAVTGVDARGRVLPEAGRGAYVGFAAPGSEMAAAGLDGGMVVVRGTSFAAPLAAGRMARLLPSPDPAAARRAVAVLGGEAADLGVRGRDPVYGRGLVAFDLAVRLPALAERR